MNECLVKYAIDVVFLSSGCVSSMINTAAIEYRRRRRRRRSSRNGGKSLANLLEYDENPRIRYVRINRS
jgi:hypothetical protein